MGPLRFVLVDDRYGMEEVLSKEHACLFAGYGPLGIPVSYPATIVAGTGKGWGGCATPVEKRQHFRQLNGDMWIFVGAVSRGQRICGARAELGMRSCRRSNPA